VLELGIWGSQFLPALMEGVAMPSLGATTLAIKAFFHPQQAQGINQIYELHLGNEVLQVKIQDSMLYVQAGQTQKADAVFYTDMRVFMGLFAGQLQPEDALAAGLVRVEGDPDALSQFLKLSSVMGSAA
jgi:putative sterol carrier protein